MTGRQPLAGVAAAASTEKGQLAGREKAPALPTQPGCTNPTPIKASSLLSDIAVRNESTLKKAFPAGRQDKAKSQVAKVSGTCLGAFNFPDNGFKSRKATEARRTLQSKTHRGGTGLACCSWAPGASTSRF